MDLKCLEWLKSTNESYLNDIIRKIQPQKKVGKRDIFEILDLK